MTGPYSEMPIYGQPSTRGRGRWHPPNRLFQWYDEYIEAICTTLASLRRWGLWFSVEPEYTPAMSVYVNGGRIFKTSTLTFNSVSATSKSIAANSSGSTRIDIVQMNDAGTISVKQGTPGAGYPTLDVGYYPLAAVTVVNGASSIDADDIEDMRFISYLGVEVSASGVQIYTTVGNHSFTAVKTGPHFVSLVGGGAGGASGTTTQKGGGGGGGGEHIFGVVHLVRGQTVTVTVGSGGTGGSPGAYVSCSAGTDGGDSKFGGYLTAKGGDAGVNQYDSPGGAGPGGKSTNILDEIMHREWGYNGEAGNSYPSGNGGKGGDGGGGSGLGGAGGVYPYGYGQPGTGRGSGGGGGAGYTSPNAGNGGNGQAGWVTVAY